MTNKNRTNSARILRLVLAALLVLSSLVAFSGTSSARPSQQEIDAAKARLAALNNRQSLLDEQYNQARLSLSAAESKLASAREAARAAVARAKAARRNLSARVKSAYEGSGSQIGLLLGSDTMGDFSDRLEFLNQIASDDQAALARAQVAGQQARWAGRELTGAVEARTAALDTARSKRDELLKSIDQQRSLVGQLEDQLAQFEARQKALREAQQAARAMQPPPLAPGDPTSTAPIPDPTTSDAPPPPPPPPPNLTGAAAAIAAAKSVLGTPYVYAGASPETGFDCSGLTMWSWSHAGVSLPHSSAAQYSVLPHVDKSQLQPGDLLFFYSPIHHVAIYLGGGSMIHAPHTGGVVEIIPVYWDYYVGAARPG
jgi:cell wall-associated NlpC family hydrolase